MSPRARRKADLFYADLFGRPPGRRRTLQPASPDDDDGAWSEAVASLPRPYRRAYGLAQKAELELDAETVDELTFELLEVHDQAGLDEFVKKLGRTVKKAARSVSRLKVARALGKAATGVGKGIGKVGGVVGPILGSAAKLASRATPLGAFARATYGALSAGLRGQNIFTGALDGLAGTPFVAALLRVGGGLLRGENLLAAAKMAAKAGIADVREAVRFAAMIAPFVPGIGTGVGAALGAADALANGQPISQALIAGVRGAVPGGAVAQAAFDTAAQLVQGKRLDQALLTAARNRLPPGPAQAAFDTGLALAQGKNIQAAVVQGAGRLLPASPYSADALSFARRALAGDNLGHAALSTAGDAVLRRARQQGGDLIATAQGRIPRPVAAAAKPRGPVSLEQAIAAADLAERRRASLFLADLAGQRARARPV